MSLAAERVLIILKQLAREPDGLSVRGVARRLGYSPGVAQGCLKALSDQDFADQDPTSGRYHLGSAALQVGLIGVSRLELRSAAHPSLERLAAATAETALLAIRRGEGAIYIDQVEGPSEVRFVAPLGELRPLNCTGVGKIILAEVPGGAVEALAADGAFQRLTERSVVDPAALERELAEVRASGIARDDEECRPGTACVAAPVWDHRGQLAGAIAVAGPAERIADLGPSAAVEVSRAAQQTSAVLGYGGGADVVGG